MKGTRLLEDVRPTDLLVPADVAASFTAFARLITAKSEIVWDEHCSECAAPACYSACAFFTPTADLMCRRFAAGIEPVVSPDHPILSRIRFRKWGKLEGRGPAPVHPLRVTLRAATIDSAVSRVLRALPLPYRLARSVIWRWNELKRRQAACSVGLVPQTFVAEAWPVDGSVHPFTVTFLEYPGRGLHQERFDVGPSYSRLVVPVERIARSVNLSAQYLVQIEPVGEAAGRDVVFGVTDFVSTHGSPATSVSGDARPAAVSDLGPRRAKVVIWDLDNTVWNGTLAEDGIDGVSPRPEAAAAIMALDQRGILNSVASKNDEPEALAALERFGLLEYFLYPQINWGPKSDSVRRIAQALDLNIDSVVYIDDEPFERGEVEHAHPSITAMPETAVTVILSHPLCDVATTPESRRRRAMYQEEARRTASFESTGTDYLTFLRSCAITLDVFPLRPADTERIYELSQRTNQLNVCGTKYTRAAVEELVRPALDIRTHVLRCRDRFGDYGIIGFAVVDLREGRVENFFMSCRVQRKRVEHAFFAMLARDLRARGQTVLSVRVRRTERNRAAVEMLTHLDFACGDSASAKAEWTRSLATDFPDSDLVQVVTADPAGTELEDGGCGSSKT